MKRVDVASLNCESKEGIFLKRISRERKRRHSPIGELMQGEGILIFAMRQFIALISTVLTNGMMTEYIWLELLLTFCTIKMALVSD